MSSSNPTVGKATELSQNAKYNIQLGQSLKSVDAQSKCFSTVVFNHKPSQTSSKRSTTIKRPRDGSSTYSLAMLDEDNGATSITSYKGARSAEPQSYILILDEEQHSFTLEALSKQYKFNMVCAPWQQDEGKLKEQYKQIDVNEDTNGVLEETSSENEEELFGLRSGDPDPGNPFDYRHYLNMHPTVAPESRNPSNMGTPIMPASTKIATPIKPSQKISAPRTHVAPIVKRQKPQRAVSPVFIVRQRSNSPKAISPAVTPRSSDSEEKGLALELGTEQRTLKARPKPSSTASNGRPLSLRAAAITPRSRSLATIKSHVAQEIGSGYEEDNESADTDGEDDVEEADNDVDELKLPGPVVENNEHPGPLRRYSTWDDEDADVLTASLEAILAEEEEQATEPEVDNRATLTRKREDSDSESEEE